ncbi:sulfur carrier protein ThiS [Pseudoalteromonas sp. PS5]|uniref:sulfur carrier protein ThiS n=1 Tax=Pseudoalteromonas sp. PS5 TaxID=1437473 RepID=UPI000FFE7B4C|nr:sulfur carrier protein ThiS [Pseudoalteromonas sp. PS5]RXF02462.1 sulfur carrier protein ThiS [Pseudoalteromonas sp. PS5]
MKVEFNGETINIDHEQTIQEFITAKGARPPFAVALNGTFVSRTELPGVTLNDGDKIELLSPIQGG